MSLKSAESRLLRINGATMRASESAARLRAPHTLTHVRQPEVGQLEVSVLVDEDVIGLQFGEAGVSSTSPREWCMFTGDT